jgi:hypothetical protein
MAKKQVIESTCDSCGKTATTDINPKRKDKGLKEEDFLLPGDWAHIRIDTNTTTLFAHDLCPECLGPVKAAIGKFGK